MEFLTTLKTILATGLLAVGSFLGINPEPSQQIEQPQEQVLGATTQQIAGTTYYLAGSGVSSSATSITLTSLTIPQNGYEILDADLSDTFYITIDPGNTARQEIVSCTTVVQNANDTATLSGCTRGLNPIQPYTETASLKFAHAGGTKVIFSNAPQIYNQYAALTNSETITGYWTAPTPVTSGGIATKGYVDALSFGAVPEASEIAAGFAELATGQEAASSTSSGTEARLVLPASLATSTKPSSGHVIPVTDINGSLNNWMSNITLSGTTTATGPTNIASSSVLVYTASSTWSMPQNLKYIVVEVVGAGGGGGGSTDNVEGAAGGGGGGYSRELIPASSLSSTESVIVGTGGAGGAGAGNSAGSTGGTSSFGTVVKLQATGGAGGAGGNNQTSVSAGGIGSGGDVNIEGGDGQAGGGISDFGLGGSGGSSVLGGGGAGQLFTTTGGGGAGGNLYGGGGAGAGNGAGTNDQSGGTGANGIVIITQVFY